MGLPDPGGLGRVQGFRFPHVAPVQNVLLGDSRQGQGQRQGHQQINQVMDQVTDKGYHGWISWAFTVPNFDNEAEYRKAAPAYRRGDKRPDPS